MNAANEIVKKFSELNEKINALLLERRDVNQATEALAKKQLALANEVIKESKPGDYEKFNYQLDSYRYCDRLVITAEGAIEMWQDGTCGDADQYTGEFTFNQLFLDGKHDEYKDLIRSQITISREEARDKKRSTISNELTSVESTAKRLREQLAALS